MLSFKLLLLNMGKKCAAYGCKKGEETKGISLHQFPKDLNLRTAWVFAMKREGFQPNKYSRVCSVHFKVEDFEVGNKSHKNRVHRFVKKHAVPSIFTTGLTSHMQVPKAKRCAPKRLNPVPNIMPKLPPVCIADGKPCCEREAWENVPIVSIMCEKCAVSCGTLQPTSKTSTSMPPSECGEGQEAQSVQRLSGEAASAACAASGHVDRIHKNLKKFVCPQCDYKTTNAGFLKLHLNDAHHNIRHLACELCSYRTAYSGDLQKHLKSRHAKFKAPTRVTPVTAGASSSPPMHSQVIDLTKRTAAAKPKQPAVMASSSSAVPKSSGGGRVEGAAGDAVSGEAANKNICPHCDILYSVLTHFMVRI